MENAGSLLSGWEDLSGTVDLFVDFLWPAVSALAAVGLVSLSLIEVAKTLFNLRRRYHRAQFKSISKIRAEQGEKFVHSLYNLPDSVFEMYRVEKADIELLVRFYKDNLTQSEKLWNSVVHQATCGDENALLDLPPDRLVGQIDAAYQLSLTAPSRLSPVLWFASGGADDYDLHIVLLAHLHRWRRPYGLFHDSDIDGEHPGDEQLDVEVMEARNRLAAQAQRQFDAWQIKFEHEWKTRMHLLSVFISAVFIAGVGALRQFQFDAQTDPVDLVFWVTVALFGGMFAPVARDFLMGLKGIRERVR